ncbi:MAG: hypothetical protein K6E26_09730 [Clostridiales bacterium]|nr:hypothetical protein [Clostridiales bacterium]
MEAVFSYLKEFNFASVVVRLLLAMTSGALIGLAVGAGFYEGAILGTALVLIAQTLFFKLGSKIAHNEAFQILLQYNDKNALNDARKAPVTVLLTRKKEKEKQ